MALHVGPSFPNGSPLRDWSCLGSLWTPVVAGLPTHHPSPAWVPDSHPTFPLPVEYLHGNSKFVLLPSFLLGKLPGLETGLPSPCYMMVHARCLHQKSLSHPSHQLPRGSSTLPLTLWDYWCPSPCYSPQKHILPHHPGDPFQCSLPGSLSYPQVVVAAITCQPKIQPLSWEAEAPASGPPTSPLIPPQTLLEPITKGPSCL